jgi:E3 ubiquitin-protein ligase EDD1
LRLAFKLLAFQTRYNTNVLYQQETSAQLATLELTFSIDLCVEEGGGSIDLIPRGRDIEVNANNVYTFVRKYSQYR